MTIELLPAAPGTKGHYSRAAITGELIFTAGQLPDLSGSPSFEAQVRSALSRMFKVVEDAGGQVTDFVQVTAYIVDAENWDAFNRIYAEMFGDWKPARTAVPVPELHYGALIEVQGVARRGSR